MRTLLIGISVLALSAGSAPPPAAAARPGDDPAIARRARQRAKKFMREWRKEWKGGYRHLGNNPVRDVAAHCHFDDVAPNIIGSGTRKSQCPTWLPRPKEGETWWDERRGIDLAIRDEAKRERLRAHRAAVIATFDSAVAAAPDDDVMRGQLIRFAVDQRDTIRAWTAVAGCRGSAAWCAMLGVYVAASFDDSRRADSLTSVAIGEMPVPERCARYDVALLVPDGDRDDWLRRNCQQRLALERTFWWLADPFWSVAGNERQVEHIARLVSVRLRTDLDSDERFDWRRNKGGNGLALLVLRYGWPSFVGWQGHREDLGHREWLHFDDDAVPTPNPEYMAPRVHVVPPWHAIASPVTLKREDWAEMAPAWKRGERWWDTNWWPHEHMPFPFPSIVTVPDQTAFFRRANAALLALATQVPSPDSLAGRPERRGRYLNTMVVATAPDSQESVAPYVETRDRVGFATRMREQGVVSVEMLPDSNSALPAGRSRFAVVPLSPLAELPANEMALSDIALYEPNSARPGTVHEALDLMFPSTEIPQGRDVGLFWEAYGLNDGEPVDVELRVERVLDGILRRIGAIAGIVDREDAVSLRWREPSPAAFGTPFREGDVLVRVYNLTLDAPTLKPGRYTVVLKFTRPGLPGATSVREFEIR